MKTEVKISQDVSAYIYHFTDVLHCVPTSISMMQFMIAIWCARLEVDMKPQPYFHDIMSLMRIYAAGD